MESLRLWEGDIPGYIEGADIPTIHYYPAKERKGDGCVVIYPGGGYCKRAAHEGQGYAEFLNENGVDAFVVDYRVKPTYFPYPLLDARRAVRYVRANAEKYGIDPEKIAVMGSSAGGHLAALVSTYKGKIDGEGVDALDEVDPMPNMQILCYPVLDINGHPGSYISLLGDKYPQHRSVTPYYLADENTPPMFLWHTAPDKSVDINNSFRYAARLHELDVSMEMHIYPVGGHGLGLGYHPEKNIDLPYIQNWAEHLIKWLEFNEYIGEKK